VTSRFPLRASAALFFLLQPAARAEEPLSITPAELVERVLASDPRIATLDARAAAARAEPRAARLWTNPALSYRRESVSEAGASADDTYLELTLPLDVSGRRGLRASSLAAGAEAVSGDVEARRNELVLRALAAYRDAAWARARESVLREGRDALARVATALQSRHAEGDVSGYDLGRIETERASFDDLLAEATTEAAIAERVLARAAGVPDGALRPATPLEAPPAPASSATLVSDALASRGERRAAASRVRQEEELGVVAERAWVPGLELGGGAKSVKAAGETASGWVAGIGLTLPLFDRGQAERERARARIAEAKAELDAIDRRIRGEVEDAVARLADEVARLHRLDAEQSPRAEQLARRAEVAFSEGEIGAFELADAHRTARDARLRALDVRWQASRSELELWRATGKRP
jgi:cobalt-zinc-cadmium efflux system outer membrane protein